MGFNFFLNVLVINKKGSLSFYFKSFFWFIGIIVLDSYLDECCGICLFLDDMLWDMVGILRFLLY